MDNFSEGIRFLIAFGSILGILLLLLGIGLLIVKSYTTKRIGFSLLVGGFVLCAICGGPYYGLKYFRV